MVECGPSLLGLYYSYFNFFTAVASFDALKAVNTAINCKKKKLITA